MNIFAPAGSKSDERVVDVQALHSRCIGGEQPAWRALHGQYYPLARAFLRRLGVKPVDLEDACQEVFVQVFRYLARFEARADFKTWLYKLCISQAGRLRRRAALADALARVLRQRPEPRADPHAWTDSDTQQRVHDALAAMKPIHRPVFVLFELEGLPGDTVAEILGLPFATVRRRLHHARQEFTALVEGSERPCR